VLLEVARKLLPPEVTERKDKKAIISSSDWIDLRAHRAEIEESTRNLQSPLIDAAGMQKFVSDYFERRHNDAPAVWRLHTASRWMQRFTPSS
jgi:hypothetical protein